MLSIFPVSGEVKIHTPWLSEELKIWTGGSVMNRVC